MIIIAKKQYAVYLVQRTKVYVEAVDEDEAEEKALNRVDLADSYETEVVEVVRL